MAPPRSISLCLFVLKRSDDRQPPSRRVALRSKGFAPLTVDRYLPYSPAVSLWPAGCRVGIHGLRFPRQHYVVPKQILHITTDSMRVSLSHLMDIENDIVAV